MDVTKLDDQALIRQCRQQNRDAWDELVQRFTPLVYRIAERMLLNRADAEDVAQESFIRIYKSFDSFDASRKLAPWISRITYNLCLKRLNNRAMELSNQEDESLSKGDMHEHGPEQQWRQAQEERIIHEAINRLSAQDRALLHLRYHQGLSDAELGEAVGMPVNTVKTRIFRARKYMHGLLSPIFGRNEDE